MAPPPSDQSSTRRSIGSRKECCRPPVILRLAFGLGGLRPIFSRLGDDSAWQVTLRLWIRSSDGVDPESNPEGEVQRQASFLDPLTNRIGLGKLGRGDTVRKGVKSGKNDVGGDGFALWILDESDISRQPMRSGSVKQDPGFDARVGQALKANRENEFLLGDVFGVRPDFNGFGVIFDSYDNDGNGDNPSIYVLRQNMTRKSIAKGVYVDEWDHTDDFSKSRYKGPLKKKKKGRRSIDEDEDDDEDSGSGIDPSKCSLDYRNSKDLKIIIRYEAGILSVWNGGIHNDRVRDPFRDHSMLAKLPSPKKLMRPRKLRKFLHKQKRRNKLRQAHLNKEPELCLSVAVDWDILAQRKDMRLVLSAMTGAVSDLHDIIGLHYTAIDEGNAFLGTKDKKKDTSVGAAMFGSSHASAPQRASRGGRYKHSRGVLGKRRHSRSALWYIFWFYMCACSVVLVIETLIEMKWLSDMSSLNRFQNGRIVEDINMAQWFSFVLHMCQATALLLAFHIGPFLANGPLTAIRLWLFATDRIGNLTVANFKKPRFWFGLEYSDWINVRLGTLIMSLIYNIGKLVWF